MSRYNQLGNPTRSGNDIETSCRDDDGRVGIQLRYTCAVEGCGVPLTLPRYYLCLPHMEKVPSELQGVLWTEWRDGQEKGKAEPSEAWLKAARAAKDPAE